MVILNGKSGVPGIRFGKLLFYKKKIRKIPCYTVTDVLGEKERFAQVRREVLDNLRKLSSQTGERAGREQAAIFESYQMLLEDPEYIQSVERILTEQNKNLEYAIQSVADYFITMFETMEDPYMTARAADVRDVSDQLQALLAGENMQMQYLGEPVIAAAEDFMPSETTQMDKSRVLGFLLQKGSANSHTAILARGMGIPMVFGLGEQLTADLDGKAVILDGYAGQVYVEPDDETRERLLEKQQSELGKRELLQELKGKENCTRDGRNISIFANVGGIDEIPRVYENDAGGIGLFRSEFLYLEREDFPTEEQQFRVYRHVLQEMQGKTVIIRTLDIGADKQAPYFGLEPEQNPAMGIRAIRLCLTRPEILRTQLRALYRASIYGNLGIMYPMITSVSEIEQLQDIEKQVRMELEKEQIPMAEKIETGIMIETPAAALIAEELAKRVDFFSIGTNDLIQYTLAADRQNLRMEAFCNPHHPAVLKLIQMAADSIHAEGKWIGICGELAADLSLTETFLQMGIDELSVAPDMILPLRKRVREL